MFHLSVWPGRSEEDDEEEEGRIEGGEGADLSYCSGGG